MGLMAAVVFAATIYFIGAHKKQAPSLPTPVVVNKPVDGILVVTSSPSGAQVFLDDSFKGNTPINLEIPIGKYEVRVSLTDYLEWEAQLQISEPGKTPLHVRLISIAL